MKYEEKNPVLQVSKIFQSLNETRAVRNIYGSTIYRRHK